MSLKISLNINSMWYNIADKKYQIHSILRKGSYIIL